MSRFLTRLRDLDPRYYDGALAAALAVICAIEAVSYADGQTNRLMITAAAVPAIALLAVRRAHPIVAASALLGSFLIAGLAAPFFVNRLTVPYLALMVVLYSLGRYLPGNRGAVAGAGALALTVVTLALAGNFTGSGDLIWLGLLGAAPFLIGRTLLNRTRLQAELRQRTSQLERDRELRAEHAVEDERARLATELQAVVANGVSAMVVQAEGVPRVIAAGDSERAERALSLIEETGRDALTEMRRLLGVLRRADDGPTLAPQPTLAETERLVERVREQGLEVELSFEGERVQLGPGADLAAYRVLQEALAAAVNEGASNATILIGFAGDELSLDVRDDRIQAEVDPEPLLAMRERLGLYGGRVRAGVADGNCGFRVSARLPLQGAMR